MSLEQQKIERKELELKQAKLLSDWHRREYDQYLTSHRERNLENILFVEDTNVIMHYLKEWIDKLPKGHKQLKPLNQMFLSVTRMQVHQWNMRNKLDRTNFDLLKNVRQNSKLINENRELKKENEKLKLIISDYEKGQL